MTGEACFGDVDDDLAREGIAEVGGELIVGGRRDGEDDDTGLRDGIGIRCRRARAGLRGGITSMLRMGG